MSGSARAERWIADLGLEPLPGESGWWRAADASARGVRLGTRTLARLVAADA